MVIEIYREKDINLQNIIKTLNAGVSVDHESLRIAQKLHLTGQVRLMANPYPLLTKEELCIWCEFLPRKYGGNSPLPLSDYSYDLIKQEVLEEWEWASDLGIFDGFLIRTPESKVQEDPILLGYRNTPAQYYLIARWGESLLPFAEIRTRVEEKRKIEEKREIEEKIKIQTKQKSQLTLSERFKLFRERTV